MTRRKALVILAAVLASRPVFASQTRTLMGTLLKISCHHPDQKLIAEATALAFAEAEKINATASDYIADSELLSLSQKPHGTSIPVSELLFSLVAEARSYAEKTNGLFDPTIGPLTKLWRESRRRKSLPDSETLAKAKAATGYGNLILDSEKSTITFAVPGMRLDLGGIAKGQTADRMLGILKNYGIPCSSITAGGDVRVGDPPPGEKGWKIGVRDFDKLSDSRTLVLSNCAVSTSGDLQQFAEINGVRYAHIIDPATGLGITRHVAATVIAPTASMSDALDAACCIASREVGEKLAKHLGATLV